MLIIDEKLLEIDDLIDELVVEFMGRPETKSYLKTRAVFEADAELQNKIAVIADNADFIAYRPELKQLQKEIIINDKVYALKLAENDLQGVLSALTKVIAGTISENIYIDENLPLKGGSQHDRHHRR